jgi:hypothetical protein
MHNSKSTNTTAIETNQYRRLIEHDHTGEVGRWGANLGGLVYPREGLEQRAAAAAALDRAGVPLQLAEPRLRAAAHRRVPLLLPPRGPRPSAGRRRGGRGEGDVRVVVAAMVDEHLLPVDVDGRHRQPPIGCLRQTGDRNVRDLGGFRYGRGLWEGSQRVWEEKWGRLPLIIQQPYAGRERFGCGVH